MARTEAKLSDKFDLDKEYVLLTGAQAAVRLALMQHERDRRAGLNTAGYVTGYRGSPIATLEGQFIRAKKETAARNILFRPGINEDLAATALWGTQQAELRGEGKYDGVFGIWYGKGPGVDRSGDAFRHANHAGTSKNGGVIALMGDDHTCESSTTAHQSEWSFIDFMIPILNPAGVQEILDYGIHAYALSRYAGVWVGIKCVKDNFESTSVVDGRVDRVEVRIPDDFKLPEGGLNIRLGDHPLSREHRLHAYKRDAAVAYSRANKLDRVIFPGGPDRKIGIVTLGKSYLDTRQALEELGLDEAACNRFGLSLYKVAMTWPFEPQGFLEFAKGLDLVMVIEEKRTIVEVEVKEELYHQPWAPTVVGKRDEKGQPLFPAFGALEPTQIAVAIGERLLKYNDDAGLKSRVEELRTRIAQRGGVKELATRIPYFCAGCPHNTSTRVPDGSRAYAGIGCHYMAQWMDRSTEGFTQMGAEGANWIGEAPFSRRDHVFQNLGDGTYIHSGSLAIRAAVAANVNVTYKILYNDAVAMTGGQPLDGGKTVPQIAHEIAAEGIRRMAIVSDEPEKYGGTAVFPAGATLHHRDELDAVQKDLREIEGVTAIIYDQTCAAEKRRRRKRGAYPDPDRRVFINAEVCEGCGDCGVKSNCIAVLPLETPLGRKREIDQSACNKDFSCLNGFCPSFVTVQGAKPRKPASIDTASVEKVTAGLPDPVLKLLDRPQALLITGIGGTGVVTVSAVLGEAAYLDGKGFGGIDMTGLAQKGGAVACHVRIAATPDEIHAIRVPLASADAIVGGDLIVTGSTKVLETIDPGKTVVVANAHESITGEFTRNREFHLPTERIRRQIEERAGASQTTFVDANDLAVRLFGDSIAANMLLLGFAFQRGVVPISGASIEQAITLNGAAVTMNRNAFHIGRLLAHDPAAVQSLAGRDAPAPEPVTLDEVVAHRKALLTAYQDARYAGRYETAIRSLAEMEREKRAGSDRLALAAAKALAKLMAYKDEYEVARLYTDSRFRQSLDKALEGSRRIEIHLAPPLLARRDPATGEPKKRAFGPWMLTALRVLSRFKGLRGSLADPFGYSAERRLERQMIEDYLKLLETIGERLTPENHATAVELALLPLDVRGFGHVKRAAYDTFKVRQAELKARLLVESIATRRETPEAA
ncbi:MAG: indolepyruvate ferredoxin oxidoreductase family protein [Hyphomicrobiaceae bacterium]